MKKSLLMLGLLAFILASCSKSIAPKEVTAKFTEKFGEIKEVTWVALEGGNFEATFTKDGKEMKAVFAPDGNWLSTTIPADESEIKAVVDYMKLFYPDQQPAYFAVEDPEGKTFKTTWMKDSVSVEALFAEDGTLTKDENNVVVAKFNEKYAGIIPAWGKTEKGNFKAEFLKDSVNYTAYFKPEGDWLMTKNVVASVPADIQKYAKKLKAEIKEVEWMETPEGGKYHVCTMLAGKETCMFFDKDAKFIEKEECKDDAAKTAEAAEPKK